MPTKTNSERAGMTMGQVAELVSSQQYCGHGRNTMIYAFLSAARIPQTSIALRWIAFLLEILIASFCKVHMLYFLPLGSFLFFVPRRLLFNYSGSTS